MMRSGFRTFKASEIIKCMRCGIPFLPENSSPAGAEGIPKAAAEQSHNCDKRMGRHPDKNSQNPRARGSYYSYWMHSKYERVWMNI